MSTVHLFGTEVFRGWLKPVDGRAPHHPSLRTVVVPEKQSPSSSVGTLIFVASFIDFITMKLATATAFATFFATASAFNVQQPRYVGLSAAESPLRSTPFEFSSIRRTFLPSSVCFRP